MVLVINTLKPDFAAEVLKKASSAAQDALNAGVWRDVKLLVRLLGCLQGLLEGDGVFVILEDLFSRAVDLQTTSSEDVSYQNRDQLKPRLTVLVTWSRTCEDYSSHHPIHHVIIGDRI